MAKATEKTPGLTVGERALLTAAQQRLERTTRMSAKAQGRAHAVLQKLHQEAEWLKEQGSVS